MTRFNKERCINYYFTEGWYGEGGGRGVQDGEHIATGLLCPWGFPRQEYGSRLPFPTPGCGPMVDTEPRDKALRFDEKVVLGNGV